MSDFCNKRDPTGGLTCAHNEDHDGGCSWLRGGYAEPGAIKKQRVHRGLSKAGSKLLSLRVSNETWEALKVHAEREFRSATGQAAWIINHWLEQQS